MKSSLILTSLALLALAGTSKAQAISDGGFESPSLGKNNIAIGNGNSVGGDANSPWFFSPLYTDPGTTSPNEAGITAGNGQGVKDATGAQAAYLQGVSSITQSFTVGAGSYVLSFDLEGRAPVTYTNANNQPVITGQDNISVTLDGVQIFSGTPSNTTFFLPVFLNLTLAGGTYNLAFHGTTSGAESFSDTMSFIDNVTVSTPEPTTWALLALGGVLLFAARRRRTARL